MVEWACGHAVVCFVIFDLKHSGCGRLNCQNCHLRLRNGSSSIGVSGLEQLYLKKKVEGVKESMMKSQCMVYFQFNTWIG